MQIEVDKEDKTISVIEAVHIRDREFEPFAFRINEEALPELVEHYLHKEKKIGRPTKEPFEPYKEIPESVHRAPVASDHRAGERLREGRQPAVGRCDHPERHPQYPRPDEGAGVHRQRGAGGVPHAGCEDQR